MILIVEHISIEGAGTIGEFFKDGSLEIKTIKLDKGDKFPSDLFQIEAAIFLGGPMNVYEKERYAFLKDEDSFLKQAIQKDIPILGICLGAQLLAKASGAKVRKAENKEIGWGKVILNELGKQDLLFEGLDSELDVFQWHEDTFDLPDGAVLLAASSLCSNQAFRLGRNAYGLQFHIEINEYMINDWVSEYLEDSQMQLKGKQMMDNYGQLREKFDQQAKKICSNFLNLI